MALTNPGALHRLAIVVPDVDEAVDWFVDVLGAVAPARNLDGGNPERRREIAALEGADMQMVWFAGIPLVLLGAVDGGGLAAKFIERYGSGGVQSLAWEIEDNWAMEHRLRQRGIQITGVSVEGRHFFMHPRDTHGLLIEWCDGKIGAAPTGAGGIVDAQSLAWVTGVVADADAAADFLAELATLERVEGLPAGPPEQEHTVDLAIGPVLARLVTPRSPASRYAAALERGARWLTPAFSVGDLDTALGKLEAAGIPTIEREGNRAWTDPAATLGIAFEWTA